MNNKIANNFSEVYAILNCLSDNDKIRIPDNVWKEIKLRKNNKYVYEYVPGDEEYLSDDTIAILNYIYLQYFKVK